jgi:hypothetical protein
VEKLLDLVESSPTAGIDELEIGDRFCIAINRKRSLMGFLWRSEALFLIYKRYASCRVELSNMGDWLADLRVFASQQEVDLNYISAYFARCRDNPFAIHHVFRCIRRSERLDNLTEFPPLAHRKDAASQAAAVAKLREAAQPGDTLFSANRGSKVSALIRRYDRCQWSHTAVLTTRCTIVDSTPKGVVENDFSGLCDPDLDVALYRRKAVSEEEALRMGREAERWIGEPGYGWYHILRLYLRNRFRIPYPGVPSVADLAYSNEFRLVGYA